MRLPRPHLTLRVLLLLVAAVAVVIGWHARGLHLRLSAITQLEAKGGIVRFADDEPAGPAWLRWVFGDDAFSTVYVVKLSGEQFTDDDMKLLRHVPTVRSLHLSMTPITDEGLKHIARLPALTQLVLKDTDVSPGGIRLLASCKTLTSVSIPIDSDKRRNSRIGNDNPEPSSAWFRAEATTPVVP
jgi:hypothetical protein